ncbi:MAG: FAD-dependent oxidoreductase, partial [Gammaproteobacteria bacterium]|nr:FAD-dependent oxidoreductase [Gammaproteobacteria bacterium]
LGDFLKREGYGEAFISDHLMPMGAAIWSSSVEQMLGFPTLGFLRFFKNHGLTQLSNRPEWRTVDGGSREYVKRILADFPGKIHYSDPVQRVDRQPGNVTLVTASGNQSQHDHVIMACHSDEALRLLGAPTAEEQTTLGSIRYQNNKAVLHTDTNLMPERKRAWASWNYIGSRVDKDSELLCVTYWMNLLQSLETPEPLLVTLNPSRPIDEDKIIERYDYAHPIFDAVAINAQPDLWKLQGQKNTWFCGAYFGYGFHEDGIQSGLGVAELLGGVPRPWTVAEEGDRVNFTSHAPSLNKSEEQQVKAA